MSNKIHILDKPLLVKRFNPIGHRLFTKELQNKIRPILDILVPEVFTHEIANINIITKDFN